jgi:multiple sugar transport system substrate-binding protein/raffinose/stachyose/melibiose transport system substrate-binding protein
MRNNHLIHRLSACSFIPDTANHSMSRFFFLATFFVVSLLFSGCDSPLETATEGGVREAIIFLHYFSGSLSGGLDDMARTFNDGNPRYELKPVSLDHEAFKSSIRDTLTSGNPPDLYSYWAGARTASISAYLEPIDHIWRKGGLDKNFPPSLIQAASEYDGKKYLLPLTQHYIGFFYNKSIFSAHGLTPPTHWDDFLAVCAQLKSAGVTPIALGAKEKWPAQFWFDLILLRTAPYEFRQRLMSGEIGYDDPRVGVTFKHWAELLEKGYFNASPHELSWDSGANELVYRGKAAMTLMGTWNIGFFTNDAHRWEPGKDFDFFPFPLINATLPKVSLGPIDGLVLPKNAPNLAGAGEAITFLAGVDAQQAISKGSGALAPNLRVPLTAYNNIQRRVRQEIDSSPYFAFNYDLATPPEIAELGLNAISEFLAFPDEYPDIQKQLATNVKRIFATLSNN